jgi:hypothetical protein
MIMNVDMAGRELKTVLAISGVITQILGSEGLRTTKRILIHDSRSPMWDMKSGPSEYGSSVTHSIETIGDVSC